MDHVESPVWRDGTSWSPVWEDERRRGNQYGKMGLRREFHYGVTTADEGLRPISPLKLKLLPLPSENSLLSCHVYLINMR